ncbi:AraC family transcriptional regulator [Actinoplanes sp. KI2]|uniref:helix-turn-helix transcriptional regulator n=1 Tax=Actinoplanes sp. KI2 TaxID=2983315 RepID=UPI0021D5DC71|nr:AraC family transcriptional regulator [Actinoplanes sp. KI2]MCU7729680.1 AraC family transcriptional regulator [Actinoplanes sp. KI2]
MTLVAAGAVAFREWRWRPKELPWIELLSVHGVGYRHPEFVLSRGYTFTVAYGGALPPVRYRGLEHPPAAAGTIMVVEPDEVVQSLSLEAGCADFTTFTLLDSQVLQDVAAGGRMPRFDCLRYVDKELCTEFKALHLGLTSGLGAGMLRSMVADLLGTMVSRYGNAAGAAIDEHRPAGLRKVRQILADRLDSNVGLDELAAVAGCGRHHLVRSFRRSYGVPPHRYRTMLRLASARSLLAQGLPVADVAARLGYFDQSQLNRHFRNAFGFSAGVYARTVS